MTPRLLFLAVHPESRWVAETVASMAGEFLTGGKVVAVLPAFPGLRPDLLPEGSPLLPASSPAEMAAMTAEQVADFLESFRTRLDIVIAVCLLDGKGALPEAWVAAAGYFALLLPRSQAGPAQVSDWVNRWQARGLPLPDLLAEEPTGPVLVREAGTAEAESHAAPGGLPETAAAEKRHGLQRRALEMLRQDRKPRLTWPVPDSPELRPASPESSPGSPEARALVGEEAGIAGRVQRLQAAARRRRQIQRELQVLAARVDGLIEDFRSTVVTDDSKEALLRLATAIAAAHGNLESLQQEGRLLEAEIEEQVQVVRQWLDEQLHGPGGNKNREAG